MMVMVVPYERTGRRQQKARTREALVSATRELLARGHNPTVEDAAAAAGISRTTAYRYFPNQGALLMAAHPRLQQRSPLPADAPGDPQARLDLVMRAFTGLTVEWEAQLRTSLRLSLDPATRRPMPDQGRAVAWIEDALAPLRDSHPELDVRRLAVAIRSASGIEAFVWLTDIAGLGRREAASVLRWSASAMLRAALAGSPP